MNSTFTRRTVLGAMTAAGLLQGCKGLAQQATADVLLFNGQVETLVPGRSPATALAIAGDKVLAVGSDHDVMALRGPTTQVVDLGGRVVIPGLVDSHMHFVRGSLSYNLDVRWDGVPSIAIAMQKLAEQAARTPAGQWVRVGGGWSEYQFAEGRMPTLAELNRAVPDKPAYVLHFYQSSMVNRAGLRALGYDKDTKALPGGIIERDSAGNPTGMFVAAPLPAMILAPESKMQPLGTDDAKNSIRQFMRELNRLGLTSVIDPGGIAQAYPDVYGPLLSVSADGHQTLRLAMYLTPPHQGGEIQDFEAYFKTVKLHGDNHWLRSAGAGELIVNDGQDWDLYTAPQVVLPSSLEQPMEAVVRTLVANNWSFREHCTFDATASLYLNVLERVNKTMPVSNVRWAVDHAELVTTKTLERVAALGGGIAIQHRAAFHGEYAVRNYGAGALSSAPAVGEMLRLGIPVGIGTDATRDTSYNPWVCVQWLVTGKTVGGLVGRVPPNTLDVRTALGLYTKGSAWFSAEETVKGTLAPGQLADFAVLSQDVFRIPSDRLHGTESLLTVVGGRVVYSQGDFASLSPTLPPVSPIWSPNTEKRGGYYRG